MLPPNARAPLMALRRIAVWTLVLAIVAQGHAAAMVQLLGPVHWHASDSRQVLPSLLGQVEHVFSDIRAWRLKVHAQLLHKAQHAHAHPHPHTDPRPTPEMAPTRADHAHGADEPRHAHAAHQRHHHDPQDPSVIALDAGSGASGLDAAAQAAAGSATLPLALAPAWAPPAPCAGTACWPADPSGQWTDAPLRRSDHPPRS